MWIKKHPEMEVRWTLHDCWAFTGHCGHYLVPKCEKWKKHCFHCPEKKQYPKSIFLDHSYRNFERKKESFLGVKKMQIITPSIWLKEQVEESILGTYPIVVMHNQIDLSVFKRTESNLRSIYGVEDKFVVLGVANKWTDRKGLSDFLQIASILDSKFCIFLIGLSKLQIRKMPKTVTGIERTKNVEELAKFYSMADVFLNLTYEDNYPTVNLEAESCGTPVYTYDTGGCRETIKLKESRIIETGNINTVIKLLKNRLDEQSKVEKVYFFKNP